MWKSELTGPNPLRPLWSPRIALVSAIIVIVAVIAGGVIIANSTVSTGWELSFLSFINEHQTTALSALALGIAWLFAPPIAAAITAVSGVVVWFATKSFLRAFTFSGTVGLVWIGSELVKWLVRRARPDTSHFANPLAFEHSFSYPSGHTTFAAALAFSLLFLARDTRLMRPVLIPIVTVGVIITALSRMYLGVHYPTDVAAAIIYSMASTMIVLTVWLTWLLPWLAQRRGRGTHRLTRGQAN